ncbi:unnamed protein product [Prorocentrum cordatum]|uniref:Uncharacterized protein n=1 Tax=Prorocentrum cordatum TaxID=2364126 RepID=A0ABN9PY69_9DINO|nr:unnamed protein product [Polarella glacialis]
MARSQRGGSSGRRSRTYWMCSCVCWNWDWRSTCLSCGHAAPPWALGSPHDKAKPEADKDGWADQPRGRRAQRQARGAASRAASTKSQTSASAASGAPSGGGVTAIERLQATVERLEALQAGPPDGVDSCFTGVVANQLGAKRAELASAQKEAAEQKASTMPRSALLHREANAISKEEKRLRSARQALQQKQAARGLAEVQLQKAQDELAALDGEVEEASRALQVLEEAAREEAEARRRQRAAEWAGAGHVPGLLTHLDKLPEAWGSSNFEVAWAAIRTQVEAVRARLAVPPSAPERAPWAESCPMDEISSDDSELRTWPLWLLALLATQLGVASEERSQGRRAPSGASAAGQRLRASSSAEVACGGSKRRRDLGSGPAPPAPSQASAAAQGFRCGREAFGRRGGARRRSLEVAGASVSRHGAKPSQVRLQEANDAPRRPEEARGAARSRWCTVSLRPFAPSDMERPSVYAGSVVDSVRCALRAVKVAWQVPSGLQHRMVEVTVHAASGLGRLACSQKGVMDLLAAQEARPQPLGARAAMLVFFPEQPIGALWEAEHDRRFSRGKMDRECEKAGWLHNACAALACARGCASASLRLDIATLYVSLRRGFLRRCGVEHGFDLRVFRGLHVLYQRPRILRFVGLATESFASQQGALGWKWFASSVFRFLPLGAAEAPVRAVRPFGARQPGGHWEAQGWTFCKTLQARNLGTGAAIAGRRLLEPCAVRAGRLRAAGVELDLIHKAGPAASAVWGRSGRSGTAGGAAVRRAPSVHFEL